MARIEDEEENPANPAMDSDETPDEISVFLSANAIGEKYQMVLKELPNGGKPQYIKSFSNYHPSIDEIGEQWGPAEYEITFSWQERDGMSGKKKPVAKSFRIRLSEKAWREPHEKYLARKSAERVEEQRTMLNIEAERARAFGSVGLQPPGSATKPESELEILTKAMKTLKDLGVPIGQTQAPQKDWGAILIGLAPVLSAVAPIIAAFVGKKREENPLLTLLITKMLDKPQGESETMKSVVPFLMGTMKQLMEFKESMKPEEKEPFIERVFDKIVGSAPMIMEFAKMSQQQREANFMYKMAKNAPETQAIMADPELQAMMVNKLDGFYGFQQTNQILEVMGFPRPPATAENEKRYPSKGYEAPQTEAPQAGSQAAQDALRAAPGTVENTGEDEAANLGA